MTVTFYKYQGTGNDFILIDNRSLIFPKNDHKLIAQLCDRKFGVGADGLILLEASKLSDFSMVYYNSDGNTSSMCGNGGRCLVAFAKFLGLIDERTIFDAIDGLHEATIDANDVRLKMIDIDTVEVFDDHVFLDTGSPHHVCHMTELDTLDVQALGAKIRYGAPYFEAGANVNFVEQIDKNSFKVRTYERGVEDETLSCGTGVVAVAVAAHKTKKTKDQRVILHTGGGTLEVYFDYHNNTYKNVFLKGPTAQVFEGKIEL